MKSEESQGDLSGQREDTSRQREEDTAGQRDDKRAHQRSASSASGIPEDEQLMRAAWFEEPEYASETTNDDASETTSDDIESQRASEDEDSQRDLAWQRKDTSGQREYTTGRRETSKRANEGNASSSKLGTRN